MGVEVKVAGCEVGRVGSARRLRGGMTVFGNEVCRFELGSLTALEQAAAGDLESKPTSSQDHLYRHRQCSATFSS